MSSVLFNTDAYKLDHRRQYPDETRIVFSNMTPRKSRIEGINSVIVFGIQAYCMEVLRDEWNNNFFNKPVKEVTDEYYRMISAHLSEDSAKAIGVKHIGALHKLGYLPIEVKALAEGTECPIKVPLFTVKNTDDRFYWLTNYIETDMSCMTWGPITSATTARRYRKIFDAWAEKTGGSPEFVPFQGHDFSYRGMYGRQAAIMSGAAHLTSFYGTDTLPAIPYLEKYYACDSAHEIVGKSVAATEHAVMCVGTGFYIRKNNLTWEKYGDAELAVFKRLITELYPTGIVSIVSDTWDLWKVLTKYLPAMKEEILKRDGKLVIRPDSGDPVDILCGCVEQQMSTDDWDSITPAAQKGVVELLWNTFGGITNTKGFKELDPHVGCIYGDSITPERADTICERLAAKGFCSTNWVAGIGSYTYQYVTRDTFGMAMKATFAEVEIGERREGIEVFKDPVTDDGTKRSARGLLQVVEGPTGKLELITQVNWKAEQEGLLQTIFRDSSMQIVYSLKDIRERILCIKKKSMASAFDRIFENARRVRING